jgi:EAL domain-containing protein (putative c-di-GMP-specific phosphodiesterase class I)
MENDRQTRRLIEKEIELAIEADEFVPYFQPQIDVQSKAVVGLEMLSRWYHPTKGVLAPCDFLQTAQNMGVLDDIDRKMFFEAVGLQSKWASVNGTRMPISVNVTLDRLRSKTLIDDLESIGGDAKGITLELLESIDLSDDDADFEDTLRKLRETGVGIEIDDFGAGRTSILAVLKVQPDRLKIDKRLIAPIVGDKSARNVVKSVIGIGNQLGITALAEGVETQEQVEILSELRCERLQGYFFGKPQSAETTERSLLAAA